MRKHHIAPSAIGGAAALLLATAPAAWADLSAETLWADWQGIYDRFGGTLDATSTDYSGGVLTLEGVTYTTEIAGTQSAATYGTIVMEERSDGTVDIRIPADVRSESVTETDGVEVVQVITMRHEDLTIVAREEGEERVYDIAADAVTLDVDTTVAEVEEAAEAAGEETDAAAVPNRVTLSMTGLESVYRSGLGADGTEFEQTSGLDELEIASSLPQDGGTVDVTYALTGIASDFEGSYAEAPAGPFAGLSSLGVTYDGEITHSGSTMRISGPTVDGPVEISGTSEAGTLALDFGERSLGYCDHLDGRGDHGAGSCLSGPRQRLDGGDRHGLHPAAGHPRNGEPVRRRR